MKKALILLAALFFGSLVVNAAPFSYYKEDKYYFQATGAFDFLQKNDVGNFAGVDELDNDNGYGIAAAIGMYYDPIRLEIEYSHRSHSTNVLNAAGTSFATGDMNYNNFMINVLYEAPMGDSYFLYAGAGMGASFINVEFNGADDNDIVFAYQFMLGVGYKLTREMSLTFGYRFFRTLRGQFDANGSTFNLDPASINALELGIKVDF